MVAGFAPITADNRRVLTQEWLAESLTMWGMAALVAAVTATAADIQVTAIVYRVVAGLLVALAVLTALPGLLERHRPRRLRAIDRVTLAACLT